MQPRFQFSMVLTKKPRFPVPVWLPSQHYIALSQYVQVHKHALTNNTSYGRNCCLEQSPGTCLQPQRQRSCFQAPAKDISVCTVLAQLTMRYPNQHIGIDIVQYASLNKKALKTVWLRDKEAVSEFQICSQNTITFNSVRTLPEVLFNVFCMLKIFATQATAKSFVVWMHQLMTFQCRWRAETLWTFIANIWLHTLMSLYVFLKAIFATEPLLTNVTREPSSFIVWLQQMRFKCVSPTETFWTMSTRKRLCMNMGMLLHLLSCLEQFSAERTVVWSPVTVDLTFMWLQGAGLSETIVTQWTLVRLVSSVDSHVSI